MNICHCTCRLCTTCSSAVTCGRAVTCRLAITCRWAFTYTCRWAVTLHVGKLSQQEDCHNVGGLSHVLVSRWAFTCTWALSVAALAHTCTGIQSCKLVVTCGWAVTTGGLLYVGGLSHVVQLVTVGGLSHEAGRARRRSHHGRLPARQRRSRAASDDGSDSALSLHNMLPLCMFYWEI